MSQKPDIDWMTSVVEEVVEGLACRKFEVEDWNGIREYRVWVPLAEGAQSASRSVPDPGLEPDIGEGYVRSQMGSPSDVARRYEHACQRLVDAGSDPDSVLSFIRRREGELPISGSPESLDAFADFLNAWQAQELLSGDEAAVRRLEPDIEASRARMFLMEFGRRFRKAMDRSRRLVPLEVTDPLVEEAGRAYLAGHYRSTVLLAWTAVEALLRKKLGYGEESRVDLQKLLDEGSSSGILAGHRWEMARTLRKARNAVAHAGTQVSVAEAEKALDLSRKLVEELAR